jgi:HlyD family secretion protein
MKVRLLILVVLLAGGSAAWYLWPRDGQDGLLRLYGNVDIREVQLGFRVAGRLQAMQFEEGDAVAAGELMASLDPQPMQEALALADARVDQAQAQLTLLRKGSRPQEIQQAVAQVQEVRAALENANREYQRQKDLTDSGLSTQGLLDAAVAQRDELRARLQARQEALAIAREGARVEEIAAAESALAAAQAQRDQAQTALADSRLVAPNKGIILTRVREPGAVLAAGSPVYTLSLTDTVFVRAYVDESRLGQVVPGTQVVVTSDSSTTRYTGQVGFVSPKAEFTPKTVETPELRTDLVYRLRIIITDPDEALRQGMPVTVTVPSD